MPTKRRERYKDKAKAEEKSKAKAATSIEELKRRRYRRLFFVSLIGLLFPVLEFIAYQFRAITITIENKTDLPVRKLHVTYSGGTFDSPDLKPRETLTRVIRPNFSFSSQQFSTYTFTINFAVENGQIFRQMGHAGAVDYSAQEIYTIQLIPPENYVQLQHTTRPGFPIGLIRDLMKSLGMG